MVDTTIYSGRLCMGVVVDTFEYADFGDNLAAINTYLTNDWTVTNGAIPDQYVAPTSDGENRAGGRGLKSLLLLVSDGDTVTRTLPDHNPFQQSNSFARYLVIRASKQQGTNVNINIRPILINNNGTYSNHPACLCMAMPSYVYQT